MNSLMKKTSALLAVAAVAAILSNASAQAQGLNNNAWSPQASNRASIAALIKQVEDGDRSVSAAMLGYAGSNVTQLVCGANTGEGTGASANAQANSSCIILNNSTGAVNIDQTSDGSQSANANSAVTTKVDEATNNAGDADDVLAVLAGD